VVVSEVQGDRCEEGLAAHPADSGGNVAQHVHPLVREVLILSRNAQPHVPPLFSPSVWPPVGGQCRFVDFFGALSEDSVFRVRVKVFTSCLVTRVGATSESDPLGDDNNLSRVMEPFAPPVSGQGYSTLRSRYHGLRDGWSSV